MFQLLQLADKLIVYFIKTDIFTAMWLFKITFLRLTEFQHNMTLPYELFVYKMESGYITISTNIFSL